MAKIKGNKTLFSTSISTELYNKVKVKAQQQGVSFSYMLQVCASVGYNVLDGQETKSAVQLAVRDEMLPTLELVYSALQDLNLSEILKGSGTIGTGEKDG